MCHCHCISHKSQKHAVSHIYIWTSLGNWESSIWQLGVLCLVICCTWFWPLRSLNKIKLLTSAHCAHYSVLAHKSLAIFVGHLWWPCASHSILLILVLLYIIIFWHFLSHVFVIRTRSISPWQLRLPLRHVFCSSRLYRFYNWFSFVEVWCLFGDMTMKVISSLTQTRHSLRIPMGLRVMVTIMVAKRKVPSGWFLKLRFRS